MQKINQNKDVHKKINPDDFYSKKDSVYCPVCNQLTQLLWVHGHYQCVKCKNIIYSCCEIYSE